MKITDRSKWAVNTIIENLNMIIDSERESLDKVKYCTKDYSQEEELRYVIFQLMIGEMNKTARSCKHLIEMSDTELRNMVEKQNLTVKEAIVNAMMNMVGEMLK